MTRDELESLGMTDDQLAEEFRRLGGAPTFHTDPDEYLTRMRRAHAFHRVMSARSMGRVVEVGNVPLGGGRPV